MVAGSVILVGGDPGIGKSTVLMQAMSGLSKKYESALYVSGEESPTDKNEGGAALNRF